ncbi:hypothetical protein M0805_000018 [Coniferiporia weirii]|nr:hypothetical protein M0805_000018 [Coniferiporia weirii]
MSIRTKLGDAGTILAVVVAYWFWSGFARVLLGFELSSILFAAPVLGAFVRFRIHYAPRRGASDAEGADEVLRTADEEAEEVRNYPHMLKRTLAIEGKMGLFKGIVPKLIVFFFTTFLCAVVPFFTCFRAWLWVSWIIAILPKGLRFPGYEKVLTALVLLPFEFALFVFVNRAITTQHALPFRTHPLRALCALSTPAERARPWAVLASPQLRGALLAHLLRALYIALVERPLVKLIVGDPQHGNASPQEIAFYISLMLALRVLSTLLIAPIEVAAARLCVVHPAQESSWTGEVAVGSEANEEAKVPDVEIAADDMGKDLVAVPFKDNIEEVETEVKPAQPSKSTDPTRPLPRAFRLRHEPYAGLVPCIREVFAEEGLGALYRGWWMTVFGLLYATQ